MRNESTGEVDGVQSDEKVVEMRPIATRARERPFYDVLLRFLGLALTLVATIIVGVDNQTKTISYAGIHFHVTAKWQYMSAIVYFLVSNAIASSYAAASLVITAVARSRGNNNKVAVLLVVTVVDLVITALLFSANGAASAVGVIAQKGNSHVQWMKVCNVFDAYCRHMTAALVLSLIASSVFLLLVLLSLLKLHYKSS